MDLSYGAENERFRLEVREFLAEGWKPPAVRGAELRAYIDDFRQRGVTKGYLLSLIHISAPRKCPSPPALSTRGRRMNGGW